MENGKVRDVVSLIAGTVGGIIVEVLSPQIHRVLTVAVFGFLAILVRILWPEEVEEEEWVSPEIQEMERLGKIFQERLNPLANFQKAGEESLRRRGYIRRKVRKRKWPWSGNTVRWNSKTCDWDYE